MLEREFRINLAASIFGTAWDSLLGRLSHAWATSEQVQQASVVTMPFCCSSCEHSLLLAAGRPSLADWSCQGWVSLLHRKPNQECDGVKASPVGMDVEYRFCVIFLWAVLLPWPLNTAAGCFPAVGCHYLAGNRWKKCPGKIDHFF